MTPDVVLSVIVGILVLQAAICSGCVYLGWWICTISKTQYVPVPPSKKEKKPEPGKTPKPETFDTVLVR